MVTGGRWLSTLYTGDLLHIPRGTIHYAKSTSDAPSLHFTVSAAKNLEVRPWVNLPLSPDKGMRVLFVFWFLRFFISIVLCR